MNLNINRDLKSELKPRPALIYDCKVRGYDTSFWKDLAGTPSESSNKLRVNSAEIASYYQFLFGIYEFAVNVPTTPSGSEAKKIGLLNPAAPTVGSIYFEIAGTTFKVVSYDEDGNAQSTTLTWSGEGAETIFGIEWERNFIVFSHAGSAVADHRTRVAKVPLALYIDNDDSDNVDVGYILAKEAAKIIS